MGLVYCQVPDVDPMETSARVRPYAPSFADRLIQRLEQAPIPLWISFSVLALAHVVLFVAVQSWQGAYQQRGFHPWHIFIALQPWYPIVAIAYLDRVALESIQRFRRAMGGGQAASEQARYRLTTMPPHRPILAGIVGVAISLLLFVVVQDFSLTYEISRIAPTPFSTSTFLVYILMAWFWFGVWVYHTIHQLFVVHYLYTATASVDLFHPEPLHALSAITSRTAILILANTYGWIAANAAGGASDQTSFLSLLVTNAFFIGLGVLIFVWPLWGAHRLLEAAKSQALAANAEKFRAAVEQVHRSVEVGQVEHIGGWNNALSALQVERAQLEKLATWPWSPGALRNLIVTLVVPVLVWAIQFGLQRLLE